MKPAINQWAFPGDMPAMDAISYAKKIGFEGFEICVSEDGTVPLDATEADVTAIRKHAEAKGIALHSVGAGLGWKYPLTSPDPEVAAKGKDAVARSLQIASWLGAQALLVVPGIVSPEISYDVAVENALENIRELVPVAEKTKVSIAVENVWNKFLLSPVETRDFIDALESEYVGAYVDVGNMIPYGYPEQWIRILDHRVHAIHMKDFRADVGNMGGFVMLMEGDVNWPAVMAALREVGFDRALTAEFGPYKHSLDAMLEHVLAALRVITAL